MIYEDETNDNITTMYFIESSKELNFSFVTFNQLENVKSELYLIGKDGLGSNADSLTLTSTGVCAVRYFTTSTSHSCIACKGMYISATSGECSKCTSYIENCEYSENCVCKICNKNYLLRQFEECVPKPSLIEHCQLYLTPEYCSKCDSGYYLNKGNCIE